MLLSSILHGTRALIFFIAYLYSDFFAPPPKSRDKGKGRAVPNDSSAPSRNSKVRFHEEVRVKMVKSHGNMSSLYETDSDLHDEDTRGLDIFDQDEKESFGDDDGEEEGVGEESEDGEDSEEQNEDVFETMERFKDDLFADEGPEETGKSCTLRTVQTDVFVPQIFRHSLYDS